MTRITQFSPRPRFRSVAVKKALIIMTALIFLALLCGPSDMNGQATDQGGGMIQNPAQQLPGRRRLPTENPSPENFPRNNQKQQKALMDYNFKKLKEHAQDLADLAKSLQAEVEKSNENVLSLEIVKKADEAEKLARKIKNEAKGL